MMDVGDPADLLIDPRRHSIRLLFSLLGFLPRRECITGRSEEEIIVTILFHLYII